MGKKKDKKKKDKVKDVAPLKLKVWKINHGPFHVDEVDDTNVPDGLEYMLVALVEYNGELSEQEFWFGSFEDAQVWIKHFQTKIEPIEVNYG